MADCAAISTAAKAVACISLAAAAAVCCNGVTGVNDLRFQDPPPDAGSGGGQGGAGTGAGGGSGGGGGAGACGAAIDPSVGAVLWSRRYGGGSVQVAESVSIDSQKRITVGGTFIDTIDIGLAPPMTEFSGFANAFLFQLDADGAPVWQLELGDAVSQHITDIRHTSANQLYVTGAMDGSLSHGAYNLSTHGDLDIFMARLENGSAANWLGNFGDAAVQGGAAVAVDGSDNAIFTGQFAGSFSLGASPIGGTGKNGFVAKLTGFADVQAVQLGLAGPDNKGLDVAAAPDGSIFAVGSFDGSVDFGDGTTHTPSGADAFLVKLDGNLGTVWSRAYGGASLQIASAVVADAAGNAIVGGTFAGTITLDREYTSADARDAFVVEVDPSGAPVWSRVLGGLGNQEITDVALAPDGDIWIAGGTGGAVDVCGVALPHAGGEDVFLVRLSPQGIPIGMQSFGADGDSHVHRFAVDAGGDIVLVGTFTGTLAFGADQLTANDVDIFVAKLSPPF